MRVLFIGLGSIAKRHIRNLREILVDKVFITVLRRGRTAAADAEMTALIDCICYDKSELDLTYDAIFITNITVLHYDTLQEYDVYSNCFFIEKPVFMTGEEDLSPFCKDKKIYYVACPLRYSNVIQYVKSHIDFSSVYSIRCISSSYLPQWRTGTDYRKSYSDREIWGGGVSADLIHEWDYLQYLVGTPRHVKSMIGKKSDLEIDADDIAVYIAEYSDKIAEIHLDYFGRETIRRMELFSRDDTIIVDLIQQKIEWMKAGRQIDVFQERDEYQKLELMHFIDMINGKCACNNTLEDACRTLRIARGTR